VRNPIRLAVTRRALRSSIDDEAIGFYQHHGFARSPLGERVMLMPIETARSVVGK